MHEGDNDLMSTAEVAAEADVTETDARSWAQDNGVQRVGTQFVWTGSDREDFNADLDSDGEGDDEGDDEDADDDGDD